ncbi:MAG: hypothetical protein ACJA0Q_001047 [Saprospiraceae bacterium]|jgi:uncharacterized protein (DUF58 family)
MESKELLKKIKRIEIKARGASKQLFAGSYHSAFKGVGMEFAEVRQYYPGDETRAIDWNVTARFNEPFIKTFEEERELTVMMLVDVSNSSYFGTAQQNKRDYMAEVCAVLAFSAIYNNDKVGVVFFTDQVEKYIPPRKGKQHVLRIIRDLLEFQPVHRKTNLSEALGFFTKAVKKKCTAFLISDFLDVGYEKQLRLANRKHDVMAIRVLDKFDNTLPDLGWVSVTDSESGKSSVVNTSSKRLQDKFLTWRSGIEEEYKNSLKRSGVDEVNLVTHASYVKDLRKAFKHRSR